MSGEGRACGLLPFTLTTVPTGSVNLAEAFSLYYRWGMARYRNHSRPGVRANYLFALDPELQDIEPPSSGVSPDFSSALPDMLNSEYYIVVRVADGDV